MKAESIDPGVLRADEFPVVNRLRDLLADGHGFDDLLAGWAYVQPRMESTLGEELSNLIDGKQQYELGRDLCLGIAEHSGEVFTRYLCIANAGYCEDKLGNTERGMALCRAAYDLIAAVDEQWVPGCQAWCCNQLAWTYFQQRAYDESVKWAEQGIEHSVDFGNAHGTLGSSLYELGDERAYDAFEEAMKRGVNPEKPLRLKHDARYQRLAEKYDIPLPAED